MAITSKFFKTTVVVSVTFSSVVLGETFTSNWNPNGEGCVNTKGFLSCYDSQAAEGTSCLDNCDNNNQKGSQAYTNCVSGCTGLWLAGNLGCWIQSCWNQVYSCEYQLTAMSYFDGNVLVQNKLVPFYPPPDSASAGACSCNLGYVYGNISAVQTDTACTAIASSGDLTALYACECCEFSWPISNILNACPNSDLSVVGFQTFVTDIQNIIDKSSDKCTILNNGTATCISDYALPFAGSKAYNPLSLPGGEPGTEPLSNQVGNAFTELPSSVYTLSLFPGYTSTITPVAFDAKAASADTQSIGTAPPLVAASATATGSGNVVATGTSTTGKSTGSGSAASTTAAKASSGMKMEVSLAFLSLAVGFVVLGIL